MQKQLDKEEILTLCHKAFNENHNDASSSQAAIKAVANTLLLEEASRQIFGASEYPARVADRLRVTHNDRSEEMIFSRILFLLTYTTQFDFKDLFDRHGLIDSLYDNIAFHAAKYSGQGLREDELVSETPIYWIRVTDTRALCESLKLLFNLSQFYPARSRSFSRMLPLVLAILRRTHLEPSPLQPPVSYLVNALLNLELSSHPQDDIQAVSSSENPMFPYSDPSHHTQRLIDLLEKSIRASTEEALEKSAIPLLTLIRRVHEIAPDIVRKQMRTQLLPSDAERDRPLGSSETLASVLLKLSTTPVAPQLRDGVSSLLFELSDKDSATFVRNVGYGYAAGYLMTHNIPLPDTSASEDLGAKVTNVDGQDINPITGQRRDMEPPDPSLNMTDEEKEREAERLFVLFERLKATGVVDVANPVEQAVREGRFEDITEY